MKYLIIDDNKKFSEALCKQMSKNAEEGTSNWKILKFSKENDSIEINLLEQHTTKEIADAVIETYSPANDNEIIFFINVNLLTIENSRQLQKGIELLIWLRIKGVMNHVVLYSFEDLHTILNREPKHLIATSKGTTFVQLPSNFQHVTEVLEKIKTDDKFLASADNIKTVLRHAINIESIRHQEANWWGVKALWDVHNIVSEGNRIISYPLFITEKLNSIDNAIADYVYGDQILSTKKFLNSLYESIQVEIEKLNKLLSEYNLSIGDKSVEIEIIGEEENLLEKDIENTKPFLSYYANTTKEYSEAMLAFQGLNENLLALNKDKKKIDAEINYLKNEVANLNNQLKNLDKKLNNTNKAAKEELFSKEIPVIKNTTRILFIDDNAANGWLDIFKLMLPGVYIKEFIPNKQLKDIDALYLQIQTLIQSFNPDVILLDLRLFDEKDRSVEIETVSGLQILKKIRENFLSIPILMTTASNKVWSYESLIRLGADAYWIKEGIDNNMDVKRSSQNYHRLLWLINKMSSPDFAVVNQMDELLKHISIESNQWWNASNNEYWRDNTPINADSNEILRLIQSSIELTKVFLHSYSLGHSYRNNIYNGFYLSSLINKLGVVVEITHNVSEQDYRNSNVYEIIKNRGDNRALEIRSKRNTASHREYRSISWNYYQDFWKDVKGYLEKSPNTP